jgi:amino-acid N-acetyltransferase
VTLTIRPASAADLNAAKKLLENAGLPTADLTAERLALTAEKGDETQGLIGLESFGEVALLRSLVVAPEARGSGIGPALVTALETACACDGVTEMWLLTIDADVFFKKLGYAVRDRGDAPDVIRKTKEFSSLCPGDAVLMSKVIASRS